MHFRELGWEEETIDCKNVSISTPNDKYRGDNVEISMCYDDILGPYA